MYVSGPKARVRIHHEVAYAKNSQGDWLRRVESSDSLVENLLLDAARVQIHLQCYGDSGISANGFNYIGLSNDAGAPADGDLVLAGELTVDGLGRGQVDSIVLPIGSGNATILVKTFAFTGLSQTVRKSALFMQLVGGVMAHEVLFPPRTLGTGDTLTLNYEITLG